VRVEVTEADVVNGIPKDSCDCAVALALRRVTEPVKVGPCWVELNGSDALVPLPAEAVAFIRRFDRGEPVEPFAFDLELPEAAS